MSQSPFDPSDEREVWYLPGGIDDEGTLILNAHPRGKCAGDTCAIHEPSDHWARDLPARWVFSAQTGGRLVRLCKHGNVHEDPDDQAFRRRRDMPVFRTEACECDCCGDGCDWEAAF